MGGFTPPTHSAWKAFQFFSIENVSHLIVRQTGWQAGEVSDEQQQRGTAGHAVPKDHQISAMMRSVNCERPREAEGGISLGLIATVHCRSVNVYR